MKTHSSSPDLPAALVICLCGLLFALSFKAFGTDNRLRATAGGVEICIPDPGEAERDPPYGTLAKIATDHGL